MRYRASITMGPRTYSEFVQIEDNRESFGEYEWHGKAPSWEHWTRPVRFTEGQMERYNKHFLYGWIESIAQSDRSPFFALEDGNKSGRSTTYEFEHIA